MGWHFLRRYFNCMKKKPARGNAVGSFPYATLNWLHRKVAMWTTFCHTSEFVYAPVIYNKVTKINGEIVMPLLCAKTRARPLKTKLHQGWNSTLELEEALVHCWSVSTIVLAWIKKGLGKLENYVANGVVKIQDICREVWTWGHKVKLKSNRLGIQRSQKKIACFSGAFRIN